MFGTFTLIDPTPIAELKEIFDRHRRTWLSQGHSGEFVVVTKDGGQGFFHDYEGAIVHALRNFDGLGYLVQEVLVEDRVGRMCHVHG